MTGVFLQTLKRISKYSPYIVTLYVWFIMSKPDLAVLLLVDYFVFDPIFRRVLFGNYDNNTERGHSQLHWILLTYSLLSLITSKKQNMTSHKYWLSLITLIFVVIMTIIVIYVKWHSGRHQLNELIGEAVGGIVIGLLYLAWTGRETHSMPSHEN